MAKDGVWKMKTVERWHATETVVKQIKKLPTSSENSSRVCCCLLLTFLAFFDLTTERTNLSQNDARIKHLARGNGSATVQLP